MALPPPPQPATAPPAEARPEPPGGGDPAQEALVRALRGSFNILRVLMIVLVVLYIGSGIFQVQPNEVGLIARLGELRLRSGPEQDTPVFGPGWHWALPDPFDRKYTLSSSALEVTTLHFLFRHEKAATTRNLAEIVGQSDIEPGYDGAMLTGDRNLSHGRWEVQYRIADPARFLRHAADTPEAFAPLLQRLTETAVVREVAGRTIEEVTRERIDAVRSGVRARLQAALDRLDTGVHVVEVIAYTTEPGAVRDAFLDVTRAENEMKASIERADQTRTEILSRAAGDRALAARLLARIGEYGAAQLAAAPAAELDRLRAEIDAALLEAAERGAGQVAVTLREARAAADEALANIQREHEQFQRYVELRRTQPRIAALGLWVRMREEILANKENEIFFVPASDEIEILITSDPERRRELEEERLRREREGPARGRPGSPPPFTPRRGG